MIINHNLSSMNALHYLNANNNSLQDSLAKLSSGKRINSAADDAAGLAISQKMQGQIDGLNQGSRNAQDGISMIQTAEGALNETHSILQRMRDLATQSANDTNTTSDRQNMQQEVDQLAQEITRISNTTEFNTQNLLAGGLNDTFQIGANAGQNINLKVNAMDAQSLGVAGSLTTTTFTGASTGVTSISNVASGLNGYHVGTLAAVAATNGAISSTGATTGMTVNGSAYTGSQDTAYQVKVTNASAGTITAAQYSTDNGTTWTNATVSGGNVTLNNGLVLSGATAANTNDVVSFTASAGYKQIELEDSSNNIVSGSSAVKVYNNQSSAVIGNSTTGQTVQVNFNYATLASAVQHDAITQTSTASSAAVIGANGSITQQATVQKGIDISTQSAANNAITAIDTAISTVSTQRSQLGAYENRLQHTINNLDTASQNLTTASSRITDVDMASEMANFTKENVLQQAAVSMLAQANQQPQMVLKLLG